MFTELPKLFDRDFAIGFFLPLAVFMPCMYFVASGFSAPEVVNFLKAIELSQTKPGIFEATLLVVILWLGGILLLVLNFSIIRLKEGYGKWNPLQLLKWREVARFRRLNEELDSLGEHRKNLKRLGLRLDERSTARWWELSEERATRFPQTEEFVLPTAFGNVIRAWEMYPLVMYGIDAIPGWDRLVYLIPEKVRPLIDQDKSFMDFWLNVWLLNIIIFVEYVVLVALTRERGSLWALLSLPLAIGASIQARKAAAGWGKSIKAAFDVYLPDLRDKLGVPSDLTREMEHRQWVLMSRAMIYRNPDTLPPRIPKSVPPNKPEGDNQATAGAGKVTHNE